MDPSTAQPGAIEALGFTLPIPFQLQKTTFSTFEFGSLSGRLRRELANSPNPYRSSIIALRHALAKLGPIDLPSEHFVSAIPAPCVEYLHLLLTARSIEGKSKVLVQQVTCGDSDMGMEEGCGAKITMRTPLDKVQLVQGSAPVLLNAKGQAYQELSFEDPENPRTVLVKYRVPTLADQESLWLKMSASKGRNIGDFTQHQMCQLMDDYDGRGHGLSFEEMDALPLRTYDALQAAAQGRYPTHIDTDVVVRCNKCGREHGLTLPVGEWMRPFEKAVSES